MLLIADCSWCEMRRQRQAKNDDEEADWCDHYCYYYLWGFLRLVVG